MKKTSSIIKIAGLAMLLMVVATVFPASADVTVYKINTDGSKTLVNNSNSPTVTVAQDASGKITISEDSTVLGPKNDLCNGLANCKSVTITPDSKLPINIVGENGSLNADKPSATIDALPATTWFFASATNYRAGIGCSASSSNYYGGASAQASGTSVSCSFW